MLLKRAGVFPFRGAAFLVVAVVVQTTEAAAQSRSDAWEIRKIERSLEVGDTPLLDIANVYGDLRVRASKDSEMLLVATIQLKEGNSLSPELMIAKSEGATRVDMAFTTGEHQGTQPVCDVGGECRADIAVFVPGGDKLQLAAARGLVEVRGVERDIGVTTDSGDITIFTKRSIRAHSQHGRIHSVFDALDWQGETLVETVTGDIRLELSAEADAVVELFTKGHITTDYSIEIEAPTNLLEKRGRVRLGDGQRRIQMRSEKGNLMLLRNVALIGKPPGC